MTRVNVYCRDHGWLFADLLAHFAAARVDGVEVIATHDPVAAADAWIAIRTKELAFSPSSRHTVAQVHDLYPRDRGLDRAGALSLTHPGQLQTIDDAGVRLEAKRILLRPIGAQERFYHGERGDAAGAPVVAWVGRPQGYRREDQKGIGTLCEVAATLPGGARLELYGSCLDVVAAELAKAGVTATSFDRADYGHDRYPAAYARMDALLVTSLREAGPLVLFEALASGVPVVSTDCGWASRMIVNGVSGYVCRSAAEMSVALEVILADREIWRARARAIRACAQGWTQETWIADNLRLAAEVAA